MKKTHTKPEVAQEIQDTGVEIVEITRKIEKLLKRLHSIGWISFKKLESIDESIAIFAAQKKLEITPERPEGAQAQ